MSTKILRKLLSQTIFFLIAILIFMGASVVKGLNWTEPDPSQPPPVGSIKAPFNVGTLEQAKMWISGAPYTGATNNIGSIGANDFWLQDPVAPGVLPLWASELGGGGGCTWEGLKCHCNSVGSGQRLTLGIQCTSNVITSFNFLNFNISSSGSNCPTSIGGAPYLAQCDLYTYQN